jgi:hypothetical protein
MSSTPHGRNMTDCDTWVSKHRAELSCNFGTAMALELIS